VSLDGFDHLFLFFKVGNQFLVLLDPCYATGELDEGAKIAIYKLDPLTGVFPEYESVLPGKDAASIVCHYSNAVFKEPFVLVPVSRQVDSDHLRQMGLKVFTMRGKSVTVFFKNIFRLILPAVSDLG